MQLGLSRTCEYDAELGAVDLIKDPRTLATALQKLEQLYAGVMPRVSLLDRKALEP